MPNAVVDGVRISYEEEGSGEPVLLLHGALGTGRRHFRHQAAALAPRYRVILPDTYGYGKSDRRTEFSADFYYEDAAQMAGLLRALGIERAHVGGFSDGAIIALCLALDYPELVHSLALAGASSYIDEPMVTELRKLTPPEDLPEALQQALARAHGDDYWRDLVRVWFAGQEVILRRGGDINRKRLGEIRCPLLLIHGGADEVIIPHHAEVIKAAVPNAELAVLPGRGHFVLQDAPEETSELILAFLERHPITGR